MNHSESRRILLVDNSNTRTKFTLLAGEHFDEDLSCLPTAELSVESIRALLQARHWQYDEVLISSVVPAAAKVIAEAVGGPVRMLSASSPMNISLDYPNAGTLGADRIANVMAAASFAPMPCVVLDFGTAVTFDVLVAGEGRPRFIGGVIAPGLASMAQYLSCNTALLPALAPARAEHAIGRSTEEALHAGSFHGYCGMVRGILGAISEELGIQPYVLATGGDAALMRAWLPEISAVHPLLTFQGLALAAAMSC